MCWFIYQRRQVLSLRAISFIEPHIYSFNNLVKNIVEDSVGVRVLSVTKHETFMCFRCKFRVVMRISNPAFSTEDFEITYIGFLVSEEFIGSLLEEFVKIYSVDDMARNINCINPETMRGFVLIEHSASHLSKSPVFALHDAILLRSIRSR